MKYKYLVAVFIAGYMLKFFGTWAKITHQSYANTIISIAFSILIVSSLLVLIKVLTSKKDSWLNK